MNTAHTHTQTDLINVGIICSPGSLTFLALIVPQATLDVPWIEFTVTVQGKQEN